MDTCYWIRESWPGNAGRKTDRFVGQMDYGAAFSGHSHFGSCLRPVRLWCGNVNLACGAGCEAVPVIRSAAPAQIAGYASAGKTSRFYKWRLAETSPKLYAYSTPSC